jgi:predicted permease
VSGARPPRLAEWWLRISLPRGAAGSSILGDLHEEYVTFRPRRLRALWYTSVALVLGTSFVVRRVWRAVHRAGRAHGQRVYGRRGGMIEALLQDVQSGVRALARRPAYTLAAVSTFALGIGVTTAISSVVYGALFRPLPYEEAERLVRIGDRSVRQAVPGERTAAQLSFSSMSIANFLDLRMSARDFENLEAFAYSEYNLTGESGPQRVRGLQVSPGFGGLLRVRPVLGRDLEAADARPGAAPVVLLGHGLWRDHFAGDAAIVGRAIMVDHVATTVIGVLPPTFSFPAAPQLWTPFRWDNELLTMRRRRSIDGIGRLAPGVAVERGRAELERIFARLAQAYPEENAAWTVEVAPLADWMIGRSQRLLLLFGGATVLVLFIACVNVANLGLARALDRRHELAVRTALGAGRYRLARHFVLESVLLALAGGALGLVVAYGCTRLLIVQYGSTIPRAGEIGVDGAMLTIGLIVALLSGVAAGLVPALRVRGERLQLALREGGRGVMGGRERLRHALVILEVALAVMLSAGAGLVVRTIHQLERIDLGIDERGVLAFTIGLPAAHYASDDAIMAFYATLLEQVQAMPGVTEAGATMRRPLMGGTNQFMRRADRADEPSLTEVREVTPGYFAALGTPLERGRAFRSGDAVPGSGVVLVNAALARAWFEGEDVIGLRVATHDGTESWEIAGVVGDVAEFGPTEPARPTVYWPYGSHGIYAGVSSRMTVLVRAAGDPLALLPAIRDRVRALDPDLPIADITTLADLAARTVGSQRRSAMAMLASLAALALVLGAIGIYGLVAFTAARRRRELGVRVALGATTASVSGLVLLQGARLAATGALLGFAAALAGSRILADLLWQVQPADPFTIAGVALLLFVTTLLACAVPARRAARLDPLDALRAD